MKLKKQENKGPKWHEYLGTMDIIYPFFLIEILSEVTLWYMYHSKKNRFNQINRSNRTETIDFYQFFNWIYHIWFKNYRKSIFSVLSRFLKSRISQTWWMSWKKLFMTIQENLSWFCLFNISTCWNVPRIFIMD